MENNTLIDCFILMDKAKIESKQNFYGGYNSHSFMDEGTFWDSGRRHGLKSQSSAQCASSWTSATPIWWARQTTGTMPHCHSYLHRKQLGVFK